MTQLLQAVINGVMLGGMYALLVLGFSVIWGVLGVINFAHGEFVMLGALLAWTANDRFGVDPFLAAFGIFVIMMLIGFVLQFVLINRVIDRKHLVSLLVMFGVSIATADLMKWLWSNDAKNNHTAWDGAWTLHERCSVAADGAPRCIPAVTVPVTKFAILLFALAIMLALATFLQRTRLGKSIRAAAQNREAAQIVGIDVRWVYAITFALCIGLTGVAGALISPVQQLQPFAGAPFTLKAFAITALSGLGSIKGALGGAMILGLVEAGLANYVDRIGANLAAVAAFVVLVAALVVRPQGLFGGLRPVDATSH